MPSTFDKKREKNRRNGRRSPMALDLNQIVDLAQGLIGRQIFIDPEIYAQELEQIFARCWLFLCHESQIPHAGDFFSTYMGEDPNGMKLASELLLDQLPAQVLAGFHHEREALGTPLLDPRLCPMRTLG